MRRVPNDELRTKVIRHLADLYHILETREPNHLSTFIYCRTKGFLDQKQAADPTETEVMLFALGFGLQDVLTPKDATAPVIQKDGIFYSPDFILSTRQNEIKTTRKSMKNHDAVNETWLDYMMGGCHMMGTKEYDLIVLYMMGNYAPPFPDLLADTFYFEEEELQANWDKIIAQKLVLDEALKNNRIPTPYQHCYHWECTYCRYKAVCNVLSGNLRELMGENYE